MKSKMPWRKLFVNILIYVNGQLHSEYTLCVSLLAPFHFTLITSHGSHLSLLRMSTIVRSGKREMLDFTNLHLLTVTHSKLSEAQPHIQF